MPRLPADRRRVLFFRDCIGLNAGLFLTMAVFFLDCGFMDSSIA
jgi:hypothetical protein